MARKVLALSCADAPCADLLSFLYQVAVLRAEAASTVLADSDSLPTALPEQARVCTVSNHDQILFVFSYRLSQRRNQDRPDCGVSALLLLYYA